MRVVDYWVGLPLVRLLSIARALTAPLRRPPPSAPPAAVCFIELSEAGSTVLAWPAVQRLRAMFPETRVVWLIFEPHAQGLELAKTVPRDNVLTIRTRTFAEFAIDTFRVLFRLRRLGVDTVVDLELFSRFTALLSLLSGATRRVGFDRGANEGLYRGNFLTHRVFYNPHLHISSNFLALVNALARPAAPTAPVVKELLPREVPGPVIAPRPEAEETARRILTAVFPVDPGTGPLILLHPDPGALPLRGWPLERFAELALRVAETWPDARVGVLGVPETRDMAETIVTRVGSERCRSLAGATRDLPELVDLFHAADLLVANDGGPAHFAAATGLPVIVLFGPETPRVYGPLGPRVRSLFAGLCCSPCFSAWNHRRSTCTANACMDAISLETVWNAVRNVLDDSAPPGGS